MKNTETVSQTDGNEKWLEKLYEARQRRGKERERGKERDRTKKRKAEQRTAHEANEAN